MLRLKSLLLVAVASAGLVGCFSHTYKVGTGGNTASAPKYSEWQSHFVYGLIGGGDVDVRSVCPSGNATVKNKISFVNGLIGSLVGVIYYPTTVEVYCADGAAAASTKDGKTSSLVIPAADMREMARDPKVRAWVREVAPEKAAELDQIVDGDSAVAAR
jgi:hypothetical protein